MNNSLIEAAAALIRNVNEREGCPFCEMVEVPGGSDHEPDCLVQRLSDALEANGPDEQTRLLDVIAREDRPGGNTRLVNTAKAALEALEAEKRRNERPRQ